MEAFADYADVKSPFMLGRSRGVADLAAAAAAIVGLPNDDIVLVRRAALVHDVGSIGVPAGILDKAGPLTEAERERIRTHPYLTARTFSKPRRWPRSGSSQRSTTSGWTDPATRRASRPTASR